LLAVFYLDIYFLLLVKQMKFNTSEDYFASLTDESRSALLQIRSLIKQAVPEAVEVFSYQMPAFKYMGMLAFYAETAKHYGLYLSPAVVAQFKDKLKGFDCAKAAIRFPKNTPLPEALIVELVLSAKLENEARQILKDEKKRSR
jgi:uncharacterized protein YdhG (YjbR/CyaY superfamily)